MDDQELNKKYREWYFWKDAANSVDEITSKDEAASINGTKKAYSGIKRYDKLKRLSAQNVNDEFLNEIGCLNNLERLNINVLTSTSLEPLRKLEKLRFLYIYGARNIDDFSPLLGIPALKKLFLENSKHLRTLDFLSSAHNLTVLGVEGSMYTKQKIHSLSPISNLKKLEALYLASVQLSDKNIDYLANISSLKYLSCARFAPKKSFESLKRLSPGLQCSWFEKYEV